MNMRVTHNERTTGTHFRLEPDRRTVKCGGRKSRVPPPLIYIAVCRHTHVLSIPRRRRRLLPRRCLPRSSLHLLTATTHAARNNHTACATRAEESVATKKIWAIAFRSCLSQAPQLLRASKNGARGFFFFFLKSPAASSLHYSGDIFFPLSFRFFPDHAHVSSALFLDPPRVVYALPRIRPGDTG